MSLIKCLKKLVKDKGVEASKQFYKNVMDQIPDDRTKNYKHFN